MQFPSLIGHSAELFRIIWKSPQPADTLASEYFRSKKYIGSKERRFVSETVFAALRIKSLAEYCGQPGADLSDTMENAAEARIILATILLAEKVHAYSPQNVLHTGITGDGSGVPSLVAEAARQKLGFTEEQAEEFISAVDRKFAALDTQVSVILAQDGLTTEELELLALRAAVPAWIVQRWKENPHYQRKWSDALLLGQSLMASAAVGLRVNTLMMSRDEALAQLSAEAIRARAGKLSPSAIVLEERVALQQNALFQSGALEVQDEGSQLIGYALAPAPEESVLDACAGAGGKTLHLAVLQEDRGEITASDIEFRRLKEISIRAQRAGLRSIKIQPLSKNDKRGKQNSIPRHLLESFDSVLVDAPCSGMGTVRRMPMAKWRLNPELLKKHAAKQLKILEEYAEYVAPGGVLVYATCSLMPDENELVAEEFLRQHPEFSPDPLLPVFQEQGVDIPGLKADAFMLSLTPSCHGTDGFFMARMVKS